MKQGYTPVRVLQHLFVIMFLLRVKDVPNPDLAAMLIFLRVFWVMTAALSFLWIGQQLLS